MKVNKILAALAVSAGFLAVSCEDQPDAFVATEGLPELHYVRYADQDIMIEQAYMEEAICLVGDNLRSINQLWFNDQQAILNTSYMTSNTLVVNVPKEMPVVQTDMIYMITAAKDTVTYPFKVLAPAPVIKSMSCEMAPQGTEATIYGDFFSEPVTVEFANATVENFTSITKTALTFTVPETALPGKVKITTASGTTASPFMYMDDRGIMFDFDDDGDAALATNASNCWHARTITTDDNAVSGNYVQLGDGSTMLNENADWNDGLYAFEYWCGDWSTPQNITSGAGPALFNLVDFSDYSKMSLKFEMNIPAETPWKAGAMQIVFQPVSQVTISGNPIDGFDAVAGANAYAFNGEQNDLGNWSRALYRPWEASGEYHTDGKWITVTIPMSEFSFNKDGGPATMPISSPNDFASLTMFVLGGGVTGAECCPIIKIDNIRAVPSK